MLHYFHKLVANFVCLLFGVEQVVNRRFIRVLFFFLHTAAGDWFDESSETLKDKTNLFKKIETMS